MILESVYTLERSEVIRVDNGSLLVRKKKPTIFQSYSTLCIGYSVPNTSLIIIDETRENGNIFGSISLSFRYSLI